MNADELQTFDFHFLVIQDANSSITHGADVSVAIPELFVVSSNEVSSKSGLQLTPGLGKTLYVRGSAVVKIARDEYDIGMDPRKGSYDAPDKSVIPDMAKVSITHQRRHA